MFDKLEEAGKPVDVEKLAKDLDVLPHTLERLMNACTGMGLLVRTKKGNQSKLKQSLQNLRNWYCLLIQIISVIILDIYIHEVHKNRYFGTRWLTNCCNFLL